MKINLVIPGVPKGQKRHRHVTMEKFVRTYDPSFEDKTDFIYKSIFYHKPDKRITTGIHLSATFYMPRPKSHYHVGKMAGVLKKNVPLVHTTRPDIDNLLKFVMDAMNKVYWIDDSLIHSLSARKFYGDDPRTEIEIFWEP